LAAASVPTTTVEVLGGMGGGLGLAHIQSGERPGPIAQHGSQLAKSGGRGTRDLDPGVRREQERVDNQRHSTADQHLEQSHLGCGRQGRNQNCRDGRLGDQQLAPAENDRSQHRQHDQQADLR
jgi:hypothetical protein